MENINSAFTLQELIELSLDEATYLNPENFKIWLEHNLDKYKEILKELK